MKKTKTKKSGNTHKPRGETWVGRRPVVFADRRKLADKEACRKWKQRGGYL